MLCMAWKICTCRKELVIKLSFEMLSLGINTQQHCGKACREASISAVDVLCHLADAVDLGLCIWLDRRLDLAILSIRATCSRVICTTRGKFAFCKFESRFIHVPNKGWTKRFI